MGLLHALLNFGGTALTGYQTFLQNQQAQANFEDVRGRFDDQFGATSDSFDSLNQFLDSQNYDTLFDGGQNQMDLFNELRPDDSSIFFNQGFNGFNDFRQGHGSALNTAQGHVDALTNSANGLSGRVNEGLEGIFDNAGMAINQVANEGRTSQADILSGVNLLDDDLSDVLAGDISNISDTGQRNLTLRQQQQGANILERGGSLENSQTQLQSLGFENAQAQQAASAQAVARNRMQEQSARQFNAGAELQASSLASQINNSLDLAQIGASKDFATTHASEFGAAERAATQGLGTAATSGANIFATDSGALQNLLAGEKDAFTQDRDALERWMQAELGIQGRIDQDELDQFAQLVRNESMGTQAEIEKMNQILGFGQISSGTFDQSIFNTSNLGDLVLGSRPVETKTDNGGLFG